MASFYTRKGDEGFTGLIGKGRYPKYDLHLEAIGTIDELNSVMGMARSHVQAEHLASLILQVQRDLYLLMAEVASTPETVGKFQTIGSQHVAWLEEKTDFLSRLAGLPQGFIVPGDSRAGAMLDMARTVTRRAERRVVELSHRNEIKNPELLRYLNRLSSLCFAMELWENKSSGPSTPPLARGAAAQ